MALSTQTYYLAFANKNITDSFTLDYMLGSPELQAGFVVPTERDELDVLYPLHHPIRSLRMYTS